MAPEAFTRVTHCMLIVQWCHASTIAAHTAWQ